MAETDVEMGLEVATEGEAGTEIGVGMMPIQSVKGQWQVRRLHRSGREGWSELWNRRDTYIVKCQQDVNQYW